MDNESWEEVEGLLQETRQLFEEPDTGEDGFAEDRFKKNTFHIMN